MIKIRPLRTRVTHTISTGDKIHLQLPGDGHKKQFIDFVTRNKDYHEPWVYVSNDPKFFENYIRRIRAGKNLGFFVMTNDTDELAGVINLNSIRLDPFSSASLGYYGDKDFSGKGYMKEGIWLVMEHAFRKIGLNRVEANVQPDNKSSIKLVKALGFTKEGFSRKFLQIGDEYKDHERWAYLAEDY